ncbi:acyl carrier protein [Streptomyces aurantiogriseus]|uniref:Acyl carrier protein n=1 Tax=Streptomyces aurantiogriseus TaxID=66870 RepID=A0A918FJC4_9ACTN|nr:phosphopantetheine-binding protein [Streptomyces aurantiogriseus]GGR41835.1 acyl carrier protein [Streptomyces aurantiogriseus]
MSATYDKLVDLLVGRFAVERTEIGPDVTFRELEMDSLFLVELVLVIQSEFGVGLDEDAASPDDTVAQAAELIESRTAAAAS